MSLHIQQQGLGAVVTLERPENKRPPPSKTANTMLGLAMAVLFGTPIWLRFIEDPVLRGFLFTVVAFGILVPIGMQLSIRLPGVGQNTDSGRFTLEVDHQGLRVRADDHVEAAEFRWADLQYRITDHEAAGTTLAIWDTEKTRRLRLEATVDQLQQLVEMLDAGGRTGNPTEIPENLKSLRADRAVHKTTTNG